MGDMHERRASGSSAEDMALLDIVPRSAGKGTATTYAREAHGFAEERTMVAGDGWNDVPMFWGAGRERGTIVGNAEARLVEERHRAARGDSLARRYLAKGFAADAIIEGLLHFGFAPTDAKL